MKEYEHLFMPIISVCDDTIGKWGIFDKKGNMIVPYVFDNILSSSDDFNYTHYEMDGITIRMSMCPIPYCKLPQMPEYIIDFLIPEGIPMFIRVYKQLVFTFIFIKMDDSQDISNAKKLFIEALDEINGCEYKMEVPPSYILEDIPKTIGRVMLLNPLAYEYVTDEKYILEDIEKEFRSFFEPLLSSHKDAKELYDSLIANDSIKESKGAKLFKEAYEGSRNCRTETEEEYQVGLKCLKWLKDTCMLRMCGTD